MTHKHEKNLLDEMQQGKLYQITQTGENLCFWCLLAAIVIQLLLGGGLIQVMGEIIVFALLGLYLLIASMKQGIWAKHAAPTVKNNALASLIAAAAIGAVFVIKALIVSKQALEFQAVASILLAMAVGFLVCFALLEAFRIMYQKRRNTLDAGDDEA